MLVFITTGCNFNATNFNEESEKVKAEAVTNKLYDYIMLDNYEAAGALFGQKFYATSPQAQLNGFLVQIKDVLGAYKSKQLLDWKTSSTVGTNPGTMYVLTYEVTYEKFKSREVITLIEENGRIEILGYRVNSEGFDKVPVK